MLPRLAALLLSIALLGGTAAACAKKPAEQRAPEIAAERVSLPGGAAALFGAPSDRGVLILADGADTAAWSPLAAELARLGYSVLVLPRSGADESSVVRAAASELTRRGVQRTVIVGSGQTAPAALAAAGESSGVALLNPSGELNTPQIGIAPVAFLAMASLADPTSSALAQQLYRAAQEPRTLALYPSREAAPAAFAGASNELRTAFLDFLRSAFTPLSAGYRATDRA